MDKEAWIKSLKPGDKVAVKNQNAWGIEYSMHEVKKIIPKGKILLENNSLYDPDYYPCIVPYDKEVKDFFKRRVALNSVVKINFSKLELSKLEAILKIIEGE